MLKRFFRAFHQTAEAGGGAPATPPAGGAPATPPAPAPAPAATPPAPPAPPASAELPADVKAQLEELAKLKADKEKADRAAMTETERLKTEAAEANNRAIAADRRAAAARHGLPAELANRLTGTTEAEIEADALKIKALFPATPPAPASTGTPAGGAPAPAAQAGELDKKRTEHAAALKEGRTLDAMRVKREIAVLEAAAKK